MRNVTESGTVTFHILFRVFCIRKEAKCSFIKFADDWKIRVFRTTAHETLFFGNGKET